MSWSCMRIQRLAQEVMAKHGDTETTLRYVVQRIKTKRPPADVMSMNGDTVQRLSLEVITIHGDTET